MSKLDDIFYKNNMEHVIQDEPNNGFCETCQTMQDWRCGRANKYLPFAKEAVKALIRELIGEDDVLTKDEADGKCEDIGVNINAYIKEGKNSLRNGLRQKVEAL